MNVRRETTVVLELTEDEVERLRVLLKGLMFAKGVSTVAELECVYFIEGLDAGRDS